MWDISTKLIGFACMVGINITKLTESQFGQAV